MLKCEICGMITNNASKDGAHYFACHLTQEEFNERTKGTNPVSNFCFNTIQPERSKREDSQHDWISIPLGDGKDCRKCGATEKNENERCGALNIVETQ